MSLRKLMRSFLQVAAILQMASSLSLQHSFYSLQQAEEINASESIVELNKCKAECLEMKDYFPFHFRYHRLIERQSDGMVKYFQGHCEVKMLGQDYQQWQQLSRYIDSTNIFGDGDVKNKGQRMVWQSYNDACESAKLRLEEKDKNSLQINRVHSNFLYYDDGSFQNLEPFTDIGSMFQKLNGMAG